MGTQGFEAAFRRGEPLADIVVHFRDAVDGEAATRLINSLAEDFELLSRPWYDDPQIRAGSATQAALKRLFGWALRRAKVPGEPPGSTLHWWEEVTPISRYPNGLESIIQSMGLTQPGVDDEGQWFDYSGD